MYDFYFNGESSLMARKTLKQIKETRRQLVDAARLCFLEHTVALTSLEQIAQTAGVTRGTIYSQFPNGKTELLEAVCDDLNNKIQQWLIRPVDTSISGVANLEQFIQKWLETIYERGWMHQKLEIGFQALASGSDLHKHRKDNFMDLVCCVEEILAYGQQKKEINPQFIASDLAFQLVSIFTGLIVMWHHSDWDKERVAQGEKALKAWLKQVTDNKWSKK